MTNKSKDLPNPKGRPSDYKPEYCEIALAHFKEGKSMVQLAAKLMTPRQTLYKWAESNKDFHDTLILGQELAQSWWENLSQAKTIGQDIGSLKMKSVSENGIIFNLRGRFHKDWSQKVDHGVSDNTKISINIDQQDAEL